MKSSLIISAGASCLILLSACGSDGGAAGSSDDSTVNVGFLANVTGDASGSYGIPFDNGMKLALKDIESAGYLEDAGLSIDVLREDTGSELTTAVTQYNKMRSAGVDVVLSDSISTIAAGIAPLATSDKMLFLTGSGSKVEDSDGYGFHLADLGTPMTTLGTAVAEQGMTKVVAVVDGDNPSFQTMASSFEQGMVDGGGNKLVETVTVTATDTDFSGLMTKLAGSGADGVFISLLPEQSGNVLSQIQQFGGLEGVEPVGTIAWSQQVFDVAENAAVGPKFALPWAPGDASSADFEDAYRAEYSAEPNAYSALGYETAWLIAVAANEVSDAGDKVDSTTLKDALPEASTSADLEDHGVIDGFSLDEAGDPSYPGTIAVFKDDGSIVAAQQ